MPDSDVTIKIISELIKLKNTGNISENKVEELAHKITTIFKDITGSVMKLEDVSAGVVEFCLKVEKQGPEFVKSTDSIVNSLDKVLSKFSNFSTQLGQESLLNINAVVKEKNQSNIKNFNTELNNISKVLKSVFLKNIDSFNGMIKFVVNTFQKIGNFIITPFKAVGDFIKNTFTSIGNFIIAPFKTISNFMKAPFKAIIETKDKAENKTKSIGDTLSGGLLFGTGKRDREDDYKIAGVSSRALGLQIVLRQTAVGVAIFWFASVLDKYLKAKNTSTKDGSAGNVTEGLGLDLAIGTAVGNLISKYTTKAFIQGVATKAITLFPTVLIGSIAAAGAAYMVNYIASGEAEKNVKERLADPNRGINRGGQTFTVNPESGKLTETKNNQQRPHERQQSGFAKGGVVQTPSTINTSNGSRLVGEAGPEAIMPLKTDASGRLGIEANVGNSPFMKAFVEQLGTASILFKDLNEKVKDIAEKFKDWFFNSTPVKWVTNIFINAQKEIETKGKEVKEKIAETVTIPSKKPKPLVSDMSSENLASIVVKAISSQEGSFGSVNKDDSRKGVSLGFMQWNASRARELLQQLHSTDPSTFENIMGSSLVKAMNNPDRWSETRGNRQRVKFTDDQVKKFEKLMEDSRMQQVQLNLAQKDVKNYLLKAQSLGITEPGALMYYSDLMHNYGVSGAKQFLKNGMSLEDIYNASKNKFNPRRRDAVYEAASQVNLMQTEQAKVDLSEATSKVNTNVIVDLLQGIAKNTGVALENKLSETSTVVNNTSNNSSNSVNEGLTAYQINSMIVEMMFGLNMQNLSSKYSAV